MPGLRLQMRLLSLKMNRMSLEGRAIERPPWIMCRLDGVTGGERMVWNDGKLTLLLLGYRILMMIGRSCLRKRRV
jgi:hypothetical protein